MKYDTATPYLAVYILFRRDNKLAFVLRKSTAWMDNYYALPAGKVDHDESVLQAAVREAKEEVGIDIAPENLKHLLTVYRRSDLLFIDILFEAQNWQGELYNAEPEKHSKLDWLDTNNLPDNVIPATKFYLDQIKAGHTYAEYGWPS